MSEFWKATLVRALKTVCQTAVATIGSAVVLTDVNWVMVFSASVLAGILSVLTSVSAGLPEVRPAIEATDDDLAGVEVEDYDDIGDYDDTFVDDEVDEGDDELEQEK